MAEKAFQLEIVTAQKALFEGEVISLTAPGELGYVGILANHAPFVTTLQPGRIVYREASGQATTLESDGGGVLEVYANKATLLVDKLSQEPSGDA